MRVAVVDGHLLHGASGNAAEMGHVVADPPTVRLTDLGDATVLKGALAAAIEGGFDGGGTG